MTARSDVAAAAQNAIVRVRRGRRWRLDGGPRIAERYLLVAAWGLMFALYSALEPDRFATSGSLQAIFGSQAALVFLAMALLCTIIVGEFVDLSVAAILGLSGTLVSVLNVLHGVDVWLASAIAVIAGVAAGAINGMFVVGLGVNVIVVTLGMSSFLLGISLLVSHLSLVSGLSPGYGRISLLDVAGLPISFWYGLAIAVAFAYVLAFTPLGRHMQFVGANREVSRLVGIRVARIRFGSFVAAGLLASVGGVVMASGLGGFDPHTPVNYLLPAFSAVFLGTAVVQPGRFNPIGTTIAVYFLATGILGLQMLGADAWVANVFYGAVLVIAVSLSTILRRRR